MWQHVNKYTITECIVDFISYELQV